MIQVLRQLLTDVVTHTPLKGRSANGGAMLYDDAKAAQYDARVDDEQRLVLAFDGTQQLTRHVVFIDTEGAAIGPQDRIALPDGTTPPLLAVQHVKAPGGELDHVEAFF